MSSRSRERSEELLEKRILLLSFLSGVGFVIVEFYCHVLLCGSFTLKHKRINSLFSQKKPPNPVVFGF